MTTPADQPPWDIPEGWPRDAAMAGWQRAEDWPPLTDEEAVRAAQFLNGYLPAAGRSKPAA